MFSIIINIYTCISQKEKDFKTENICSKDVQKRQHQLMKTIPYRSVNQLNKTTLLMLKKRLKEKITAPVFPMKFFRDVFFFCYYFFEH